MFFIVLQKYQLLWEQVTTSEKRDGTGQLRGLESLKTSKWVLDAPINLRLYNSTSILLFWNKTFAILLHNEKDFWQMVQLKS